MAQEATPEEGTDSENDVEMCAVCGNNPATERGVFIEDEELHANEPLCYHCHPRGLATDVDRALRHQPKVSEEQRYKMALTIIAEGVTTKREPLELFMRRFGIPREERLLVLDEVL